MTGVHDPATLDAWLKGVFERETAWNSADEKRNPWVFICPQEGCYYAVAAATEGDAQLKAKTHAETDCPHQGGDSHYGASITMTLVETMWEMADREYDKLLDAELEGAKLEQQRGILAGEARMIALFMTPRFKTMKDVSDELGRRRNARQAGTDYVTPGLGTRRFEIPKELKTDAPTLTERAEKIFKPSDIETIKKALQLKAFTVPQLAKMYSCSEAVIRQFQVD